MNTLLPLFKNSQNNQILFIFCIIYADEKKNLKVTGVCYASSLTSCEMSVVEPGLRLVSLPVAVETQPMWSSPSLHPPSYIYTCEYTVQCTFIFVK